MNEKQNDARHEGPLEALVGRLNDYGRAHEGYSDDPYERQKAADMYDAADVIETTLKTQHLDIARDFAAGYKAACKIHAQAEIKRLRDALKVARDAIYYGSFPLGWNIDRLDEALTPNAEDNGRRSRPVDPLVGHDGG